MTDMGGSLSLVKTGAGTFTLPINATHSGTTTVSGGILDLTNGQVAKVIPGSGDLV